MNKNLVYLLCMIALIASCSPAYRTAKTPDDVYYSPGNKQVYADVEDHYESYPSSSEDDYLRMKVKDRDRWAAIDDYNYWYDSRYYANNYYSPYTSSLSIGLGYGLGFGGLGFGYGGFYPSYAYNPYWYNPWGSWYNPNYTVVYYKNPGAYYRPLRNNTNVSAYSNRTYSNRNMPLQTGNRANLYNNSNSSANRIRNNNYNTRQNDTYYRSQNNNNSAPSRTFNNSNSGGSSMSSGSRISGGGARTRP